MADKAPSDGAAVCPVDHKTRELWLQQAREQNAAAGNSETNASPLPPQHPPHPPHPLPPTSSSPAKATTSTSATPTPAATSSSFWQRWSSAATSAAASSAPIPPGAARTSTTPSLGTDREVSSIPRTATASESDPSNACPVNHEVETGADPHSGNWIYPSEKMFFDAMKRKGNDSARVADMKVVVPIHNAVNERAWQEICAWEKPYLAGTACDGPRLHSFSGLSHAPSPKARINALLGYQAPFDRHDWVVDRCGTQIEYVIDFYAGRPTVATQSGGGGAPKLSFYLDVRPKLNSWEGVKMRALRAMGLA